MPWQRLKTRPSSLFPRLRFSLTFPSIRSTYFSATSFLFAILSPFPPLDFLLFCLYYNMTSHNVKAARAVTLLTQTARLN